MSFRTRFDRLVVSPPSGGETLTQAHFAQECDINRMIQRFLMGDPSAVRHGRYGDFTHIPESLHDACNRLANASSIWENMPESIRASYGSPEALLAAIDAFEAAKGYKSSASASVDSNSSPAQTAGSDPAPVPSSLDK